MNIWAVLDHFIKSQDEAYLVTRKPLVSEYVNLKFEQGRIKRLLHQDEIECIRAYLKEIIDWREGRQTGQPLFPSRFPDRFYIASVRFRTSQKESGFLTFPDKLRTELFISGQADIVSYREYMNEGHSVVILRFMDMPSYSRAREAGIKPYLLSLRGSVKFYCEDLDGRKSSDPSLTSNRDSTVARFVQECIQTFDRKVIAPSTLECQNRNIKWIWERFDFSPSVRDHIDGTSICEIQHEMVDMTSGPDNHAPRSLALSTLSVSGVFLPKSVYSYVERELEKVHPISVCSPTHSYNHLVIFTEKLGELCEGGYIEFHSGCFYLIGYDGSRLTINAGLPRGIRNKLAAEIYERFSVDVHECWENLLDLTREIGRLVTINNPEFVLRGTDEDLKLWFMFLRAYSGDWLTVEWRFRLWRFGCAIAPNLCHNQISRCRRTLSHGTSGKVVRNSLLSARRCLETHFNCQSQTFDAKLFKKEGGFLRLKIGKAFRLGELLGELYQTQLLEYRQILIDWMHSDRSGDAPLLNHDFPVKFAMVELIQPGCPHGIEALAELIINRPGRLGHLGHHAKKSKHGSESIILCFRTMDAIVDPLGLTRDRNDQNIYHGEFRWTDGTVCRFLARNNTLKGFLNIDGKLQPNEPLPASPDEIRAQLQAWQQSEMGLAVNSIYSPALQSVWGASLGISRQTVIEAVNPLSVIWLGEADAVNQVSTNRFQEFLESRTLHFNNCYMRNPMMQFIQNRLNNRVRPFGSKAPYPSANAYAALHSLLEKSMKTQEELANREPRRPLHDYVPGGIEKDLNTALEGLSVYDPYNNPCGILVFPTYLPSHLKRLCEWFDKALPELTSESGKLHFVHIDSEGQFFQLHTECSGCLIIHTGIDPELERELGEDMSNRFGLDVFETWESLQAVTKDMCRLFTLNRRDVVFGGDVAGCPIASQTVKRQSQTELPWMDSDMTGWYSFIQGRPNIDWFCARSIDTSVAKMIETTRPIGWKSIQYCGEANTKKLKSSCICAKKYGWNNLKSMSPAHPQIWHSFPQSGATVFKSLQETLDWTVLYYAIADLIKARSLTLYQDHIRVDVVRPQIRDSE
jgi:Fe-S cluster biogenesis protein NfuA